MPPRPSNFSAPRIAAPQPVCYHTPLDLPKGITMARPGNNHRLRWRSKRANKGRKPSKGRVKGWGVKNYPHLYA
jgi:hypothetical protein